MDTIFNKHKLFIAIMDAIFNDLYLFIANMDAIFILKHKVFFAKSYGRYFHCILVVHVFLNGGFYVLNLLGIVFLHNSSYTVYMDYTNMEFTNMEYLY